MQLLLHRPRVRARAATPTRPRPRPRPNRTRRAIRQPHCRRRRRNRAMNDHDLDAIEALPTPTTGVGANPTLDKITRITTDLVRVNHLGGATYRTYISAEPAASRGRLKSPGLGDG